MAELTLSDKKRHQFTRLAKYRMERKTIEQIAGLMAVATPTIKRWTRDPSYRTLFDELQKEWREQAQATVHEVALDAINTLQDIMHHSKSDLVRYHAAAKLADLAGLGKERLEDKADDREDLRRLAQLQNARKLALAAADQLALGPVIDGTFTRLDDVPASEPVPIVVSPSP